MHDAYLQQAAAAMYLCEAPDFVDHHGCLKQLEYKETAVQQRRLQQITARSHNVPL
jgi:hypothetical protein